MRLSKRYWPIRPMLARRASEPFDSDRHIFELKWDGTRCIAFTENKVVRLQNRRLSDITYRYPEFKQLPHSISAKDAILDGEVVVFREGRADFTKLQTREQTDNPDRVRLLSVTMPATYVVFDIIYHNGRWMADEGLLKRREVLRGIVREEGCIIYSEEYMHGRRLFREAIKQGFEGIMAKEKESPYLPGQRSGYWLKVKRGVDVDAVVCGWIASKARPFASLILGLYRDGRLYHIGQVGTGFNREEFERIHAVLTRLETRASPFEIIPRIRGDLQWVHPELVVRVSAMQWTEDGRLRAPVFVRLRPDKRPEECERED